MFPYYRLCVNTQTVGQVLTQKACHGVGVENAAAVFSAWLIVGKILTTILLTTGWSKTATVHLKWFELRPKPKKIAVEKSWLVLAV